MTLLVFPIVAFAMLLAALVLAGVRRPFAWSVLISGCVFFAFCGWIILGGWWLNQHQAMAEPMCQPTPAQAAQLSANHPTQPEIDYGGLAGPAFVPCKTLKALRGAPGS